MGLGRSAAFNLQTSVVWVSSRFGEMFDREMARTRDDLAVATSVSVAELSENGAQVSTELTDSSTHSLPRAPSSGC